MSRSAEWARAYAIQAEADFQTYDELQHRAEIPKCHKLQFLQMACEKLCKAELWKSGFETKKKHAYVAKHLPTILKVHLAQHHNEGQTQHLMRHFRHLAREIELLSPAVDDGGRCPDNCEYPWEVSDGDIRVPAKDRFTNLNLNETPGGRTFLKYVRHAISELT